MSTAWLRRRRLRARFGLRAAAAIALSIVGACADAPTEPGRYIARFKGAERRWIPEPPEPIPPQAKPAMLIYEVTRYPDQEATQAQRAEAESLRDRSFLAAAQRGWYEYDQAVRDGYHLVYGDEVHYVNDEYIFDDRLLDPERPEFLMYYDTSQGKRLVGFMYYVRSAEERGPQIGGPLTVWHYHVWSRARCFLEGVLAIDITNSDGECARGAPSFRSPEMLHIWLVDHPDGTFATRMQIAPQLLERLVRERGF